MSHGYNLIELLLLMHLRLIIINIMIYNLILLVITLSYAANIISSEHYGLALIYYYLYADMGNLLLIDLNVFSGLMQDDSICETISQLYDIIKSLVN